MGEGSLSLRETGDSADGLRERQETGGEGGAADSGSPARQVVGGHGSRVPGSWTFSLTCPCTLYYWASGPREDPGYLLKLLYVCLSVLQGPQGPQGPLGPPGEMGPKVSAEGPLLVLRCCWGDISTSWPSSAGGS